MRRTSTEIPELVPILSRGKHRNPRKGACFMEMASYLAGERWSDHPRCTHPLVATVARLVNDHTSERHRQRLAVLIPSVIGLTTDDPRADVRIALRCATTALPVASAARQRVLAVSVLAAERALATIECRPLGRIGPSSTAALAHAPAATRWARTFVRGVDASVGEFCRNGTPQVAHTAVVGIAEACVPDPDDRLYHLLSGVIDECAAVRDAGRSGSSEPQVSDVRTPGRLDP
jgi:hypothetical protein